MNKTIVENIKEACEIIRLNRMGAKKCSTMFVFVS